MLAFLIVSWPRPVKDLGHMRRKWSLKSLSRGGAIQIELFSPSNKSCQFSVWQQLNYHRRILASFPGLISTGFEW
jgi:hypothetical protein